MKRRMAGRAYSLFLALAILPLVDSIPVEAGWTNLGLYGGQVYSIALDKNNPSKMFAGAYYGGGLFRTDDAGANWTPVLTGNEGTGFDGEATFSNTAVWGVQIAPSDSNVVWAVHNYWAEKSTDGGDTWTHILNSSMQGSQFRWCKSLAIDPANPLKVYVGSGGPNSSNLKGSVYRTADGGSNWIKSGISGTFTAGTYTATLDHEFYGTVVDVVVHPTNSNIVWVMDFNDVLGDYIGFLYLSTDGGQTWAWDVGVQAFIGEQGLAVKPDEPNVLFIASFYGLVKVTYPKDGSGNILWSNAPTVTYPIGWGSGKNIRAIAFSPNDPSTVYYAGFNSKIGKSTNGGSTFTQYEAGKQFITLTPHPADGNIIFGGERLLGVYQGTYNSGLADYAWVSASRGINAIKVNDIAVDPNDSTHLVVGTQAGVFEKIGGGDWTSTAPLNYTEAFSVAFDPSDTDGSTYYAGIESYLAKTTNHGTSWSYSNNLGYPHYVNHIAVDPNDSTRLFVTTRDPGGVYKSINSGATLTGITPSSTTFDFNAVAIDPNDSTHVFAGGGTFYGAKVLGKLYQSTDGGSTWNPVLDNVIVNALLIDPSDSNVVYAGCGYYDGTDIPFYKSVDSGASWQKAYEGIPGGPIRYGVWGTSASNLYVLRHSGSLPKGGTDDSYMIRYDGSAWSKVEIGASTPLYGIWGYDANNIFAVGESGTVVRYNGSSWSAAQQGSAGLRDVWGSSATNVYAVGKAGTILRFDGSNWTASTGPTGEDLHGIWGNSASNIYAVGSSGVILRYDGSNWTQMIRRVRESLADIWGSSSSNIFAVGSPRLDGGNRYYTILRWDGSIWTVMTTPAVPAAKSGRLHSVWGSSGSDVFAEGDDGVILHYNGTAWSAMTSGTSDNLYGVWGTASSNVYAVGVFGSILRYNGTNWSAVDPSANISDEKAGLWNAVTDLAFSPDGHIYAATERQGVYASANGAKSWINLSAPPYSLYAVAAGSVISGGSAGTHSLAGEGLLFGSVTNTALGTGLHDARVNTDIQGGKSTTTEADGSWSMLHFGGTFNVTASKPGFAPRTEVNVPIYDGTWTQVTFELSPAATGPEAVIGAPSATLTRSGPVTYTVTYTEADAVLLTNSHVTLNATGTAGGVVDVSGAGNVRTVTISAIAGNGTLGISIAPGSAYDHSGVPFPAVGPSATFTVDNTAPTVGIGAPSATLTRSGPVTYTVTYAGADTVTLANANVTLNKTGTANGTVAVTGTGTGTRTVTISGVNGNGTLGISIASGTASDTAGNLALAAGPSATFTVDNTAPTIVIGSPSTTLTRSGPVTYTVTYNGADTVTLANANVTLNKTGTANGTAAVTGSGTGTRTVTISGITGDGTLGVSIAAGTAGDTAGNHAPAAGPSGTFTVDNTAPTIAIGSPSATITRSGPVTYTVTYNGADTVTLANANVTLNKTGTANGTAAVTGSGTGTRTVTISGITGDGTLGISIANGTAGDTAGNLAPAAGPSAAFTADNTAPNAPAVSGPSSTHNRRPAWAWTTGGGNGTYRYRLDSSDLTSGATETMATSCIPAADLSLGLHTLYVQERDAAGNWSPSGSFAVRIVSQGDLDGNGTIDLRDAILALRMISALPPGADIYHGADVDGDERIGTGEIIYILQRISLMRE